jgi:hypothetical protein
LQKHWNTSDLVGKMAAAVDSLHSTFSCSPRPLFLGVLIELRCHCLKPRDFPLCFLNNRTVQCQWFTTWSWESIFVLPSIWLMCIYIKEIKANIKIKKNVSLACDLTCVLCLSNNLWSNTVGRWCFSFCCALVGNSVLWKVSGDGVIKD